MSDAVVGVDGCRGGWVGVAWSAAEPVLAQTLGALLRAVGPATTIAIDIPIGLAADGAGDRACDKAARRHLGRPRASSVFPPPTRAELAATARPAGMSVQTWNILPKIRETDAFLARQPAAPLVESHPELCFAVLAGAPLAEPKRTAAGRARREALLRAVRDDPFGPLLARTTGRIRAGSVVAARDDLLDACVLAWSARRYADGAPPLLAGADGDGARIWAPLTA